jgi:DNA-binding SARP family transcriptional activator
MALTNTEAKQISLHQNSNKISEEVIEGLNKRANGWAAGLILLLEGAGEVDDQLPDSDLFNYFAAEIMHRVEADTQTFLTVSALLPVMDGESVAALTGNDKAEDVLRQLVRRNYFITQRTGVPARYEYHPLFREFLLVELTKNIDQEQLQTLQQKAGHILSEKGEYSAAIELLNSAEAEGELIALVMEHAGRLVGEGQFQTLKLWLSKIPEQITAVQPWLLYWNGVSLMITDLLAARKYFERAYDLFDAGKDSVGLYLSWVSVADTYSLMRDDYNGMKPWLEKYESLRNSYTDFPSPELEIKVLTALFGILTLLQPNHPLCADVLSRLEQIVNTVEDPDSKVKLLTNLATYYVWVGDYLSVNRHCDAIGQIAEKLEKGSTARVLAEIISSAIRSNIAWVLGDTETAKEIATNALHMGDSAGIYFTRALIVAQLVYVYGIENNLEKMAEYLQELKNSMSPESRLDHTHYLYQLSWYSSLKGEHASAVGQSRQALKLGEQVSACIPAALCKTELAIHLIQIKEFEEVHALLDAVQDLSAQLRSSHLKFEVCIVRAYAWLQQNNESACEKELTTGFKLGMEHGYVNISTMDRRILSALCEFSLVRNIEPDYAKLLISKWELTPAGATNTLDAWPWSVKIRTFGKFAINLIEKPDASSGKRRSQAQVLLKALVSFGEGEVLEQTICDLLWPDAEGDMARQNLKITLHRLRKLIGQESVLLRKGLLSLNSKRVWVDAWALERVLGAIDAGPDDQIVSLVADACSRYSGEFLYDEVTDWALSSRERLHSRFLRIINGAIERLCKLGQWQESIDCCQKALEVDPLAERFYIQLMRCYYTMGKMSEGIAIYHRCQDILVNELNVHPSAEAEKWYERLQQN